MSSLHSNYNAFVFVMKQLKYSPTQRQAWVSKLGQMFLLIGGSVCECLCNCKWD